MYLPTSTLLKEMATMQREVDRLFTTRNQPVAMPALNAWRTENGAMVSADLPGVPMDDITVTVLGKKLTIEAARTAPELAEGERFHLRERNNGTFSRSVNMPFTIDRDSVMATLENGVLTIAVAQSEADKPRKIEVKPS